MLISINNIPVLIILHYVDYSFNQLLFLVFLLMQLRSLFHPHLKDLVNILLHILLRSFDVPYHNLLLNLHIFNLFIKIGRLLGQLHTVLLLVVSDLKIVHLSIAAITDSELLFIEFGQFSFGFGAGIADSLEAPFAVPLFIRSLMKCIIA